MRDVVDDIKEAFLTGVSYMLPFVVAGVPAGRIRYPQYSRTGKEFCINHFLDW